MKEANNILSLGEAKYRLGESLVDKHAECPDEVRQRTMARLEIVVGELFDRMQWPLPEDDEWDHFLTRLEEVADESFAERQRAIGKRTERNRKQKRRR